MPDAAACWTDNLQPCCRACLPDFLPAVLYLPACHTGMHTGKLIIVADNNSSGGPMLIIMVGANAFNIGGGPMLLVVAVANALNISGGQCF